MNRKLLFYLVLAIARGAHGETIEALIAAGELEARAIVQTPAPHFQKAPIVIAVEVGTSSRFSPRGTRVRDFTVPGTVMRPSSTFAFNETRRREGDTWAFQSWRFELHSGRVGALSTPPLKTFISVENGTNGVVEGEVELQVPQLDIEAPPGTEGLDAWVAATEFKVDESWEGVLETYQIGDAVTRIRQFTIKGAPAMAIPASPQTEIDGIQVYYAPVLVDDKTVGSSIEGMRKERVVFTVESGGTHTVPSHRIHWFNLKTKKVEQIDFPSRTLDVSGAARPAAGTAAKPREGPHEWLLVGLALLGAAFGYVLLRWLRRRTWYPRMRDRLEARRERRRARTTFMRAAAHQDSSRCLMLLYERLSENHHWQLNTVCSTDPELHAISAALLAHAYSDGQPLERSELLRLWEACTETRKRQNSASTLRLNPAPSK